MADRKTEPGITAVFLKRIKVEKPGNLFACAMIKFKKPAYLKENNISGKHLLKVSILLPYHPEIARHNIFTLELHVL